MARFVSLCLLALVAGAFAAPANNAKIHSFLRKTLETKSRVNILVSMKEGTEATLAALNTERLATRAEKSQAVYDALNALADKSQAATLEMLRSPRFFAFNVRSFWISNQIYVQGADQYLIDSLAEMDDVSLIEEEEIVYLDDPAVADPQEENTILAEWGIEKIQSEQAWAAAGTQGQGAVVGVIDTGARYTHNLIAAGYRGGNNAWYNPYASQANPTDGHGHGTHVTGTIAGSGGIGVAPGAQWISCKGLRDDGSGTNAGLLACGQFITCPHNYQGGGANCNLSPDVSSNSWGGAGGSTWFNSVITAWVNAGIAPVFAAGNSGSACRTTGSPGDASNAIAVGATTTTDAITSFSSRGPANAGNTVIKPFVSAPGNSVRSAGHTSNTAYATMSGTSMACPHVAGVVALMRAKRPSLTVAQIRTILQNNSDRNIPLGTQNCGGTSDSTWPNNTHGYGRVNALRAVNAS